MTVALLCLLIFHGVVGGIDVLVNHELVERLPAQPWARSEEGLHSLRELSFAMLFGGLGWLQWNGVLVWFIAAIVAAEFFISLTDTLLEDRIRRVPPLERALHVVLFINLGAYGTLLFMVLSDWRTEPTGIHPAYHGLLSWLLGALSLASFVWSARDGISYFRLGRVPRRAGMATAADAR